MKETQYTYSRLLSAICSPAFVAFRVLPVERGMLTTERGAANMRNQTDEFHPHAAKRLFLAVVNQAISDVLENNEEAKAAEQWLLSEEFDNFAELLRWEAERFHQQPAVV